MASSEFEGFPKECLSFFEDLERHNDKQWFDARRKEYDEQVMAPARAFVESMGVRLQKIAPEVVADPKVNRSLFRINRDTRFSKDKRPYKTTLAVLFWEGTRKRMECPGFYFHLEPKGLMLGGGMYMFPKDLIEPYRESVVHEKFGPDLAEVVRLVGKRFKQDVEGVHYKRVPRGYDKDHPFAELLLHNGLYVGANVGLPLALHSSELLDLCFDYYRKLLPLHEWLVALLGRASR